MKRRYILLLDGTLLLLVPVAALLSGWMLGNLPACGFLRYGILCPACGGTRCVKFLSRGQLAPAFQMNPYLFCTAFLALGLVILLNVVGLSQGQRGTGLLKRVCRPIWLILWAVGFSLFGILRNIV